MPDATDVEAPALNILWRRGLGDGFKMRFGYGVSYPPSWLKPFNITRPSNESLRTGMTLVMHTCLLDEAHSIGSAIYAETANGHELPSGAGDVEMARQ